MAATFSTSFSREQLSAATAGVQLNIEVQEQTDLQKIIGWLSRLKLLYGVPFNYLVPDVRMLPEESIRFFQVDQNWVEALIDGAFSIGTTSATEEFTQAMLPQIKEAVQNNLPAVRAALLGLDAETLAPGPISGFFLRSAAVSGWPGLEVEGFSNAYFNGVGYTYDTPLTLLRLERISPSLLFGLFAGTLKAVRLRQPAETLHFAFDPYNNEEYGFMIKRARYVNSGGGVTAGQLRTSGIQVIIPDQQSSRRALNIDALASSLQQYVWAPGTPAEDQVFTSAQFGMTMVQITDQASFIIDNA
ncbi:MAG: hypothetical protein MUC87_21390 [Bacteroidia bacterium]|jgi:hypothetical protein|nr:hypothetical protein [Bacteroidia bacterium]